MPTKTLKITFSWIGAVMLTAALLLTAVFLPGPVNPAPEISNPPTTEETQLPTEAFAYENGFLTCTSKPSILGIDVSVHQGDIDWQQVKDAGVQFVMLRVAYRGSIEGLIFADEMAQKNYLGAKAAGLDVGAYIFTQSISAEEGLEDAAFVLDIVKNWQLDMPLVYDWEIIDPSYRNAQVDMSTLTAIAKAFCQKVENAGYDAMIYFNPIQAQQNYQLEELADYGLWLAHYTQQPALPPQIDMWQYTCTGSVPGIAGNVDINLYFPQE